VFRIGCGLPVGLLGPHEDCGDFHETFALIRDEDNAPPADAFAVTSLPLRSLQGFHVATEGVLRQFTQAFEEKVLVIPRDLAKLFCGGF
jgi:hypothetical protein